MKVWIPQPLRSYTGRESPVQAEGATLAEVVEDLDVQFPGIRFRMINEQDQMRPHVRFFVNKEQVLRLDVELAPTDEIHIFQALSGG